jgi:hypothetical protein
MIKVIDNYLTNSQCYSVIQLWDESKITNVSDNVYRCSAFDLMNNLDEITKIIPDFSKCNFKNFRLQCVDENIEQIEVSHIHKNYWSFVIFLNDSFTGGKLIFDNNTTITPKIGTMVYFTGDEAHKVENCIGKRWTLVGFLHNSLFKIENIHII